MNQFFTWSRRANAMATKAPKNGAYTAAERTHTRGQQSPTDTVMTHTLPWSARKRNGNSTHRRRHGTHIHTARTQTGGQQTPADALTLHTHTHCGALTYATATQAPVCTYSRRTTHLPAVVRGLSRSRNLPVHALFFRYRGCRRFDSGGRF